MTKPFSILKEDYENSSRSYIDIWNCPAATAFKRQYPDYEFACINPYWVTCVVGGELKRVGNFKDSFGSRAFELLKQGKEFHTEITFND